MHRLRIAFQGIDWLVLGLPLLIGLPFLVIGLGEVFETAAILRSFERAPGMVVGNDFRPFAEGGAAYVPLVEFETKEGQILRFADGIGTIPPEYEVGENVPVLYDPAEPEKARVYSWKRIWFAPLFISAIGLLPILVGLGLALLMRPKDGVILPSGQRLS